MMKRIIVKYNIDNIEEHFDKKDLMILSINNDTVFQINKKY